MGKKYKDPLLEENSQDLGQSYNPVKREVLDYPSEFEEVEIPYVIESKTRKTKSDFNIVNPNKVLEFINNYEFLEDLLVEANEAIKAHFRDPQLSLEVITDPDNSNDTQLVLSINPNYTPKVAIKKFDTFSRTWWFDALKRSQNKLAIILEYR